jgi:hypothetical protein
MDKITDHLPVHASGKEKTAFKLNDEQKILISWNDDRLRIPEFAKSVYYLQKIFHTLRPSNFVDAHFANEQGVVVDKIPDNPDFSKANAIQKREYVPKEGEELNSEWSAAKKSEMLSNGEFQEVSALIDTLLTINEWDWGPDELAEPINSTVVNTHPVVVELFNPVRFEHSSNTFLSSLNLDALKTTIASEREKGTLSEEDAKLIETYAERFEANVKQLKEILSGKNSTPPDNGYVENEAIPEELVAENAPW